MIDGMLSILDFRYQISDVRFQILEVSSYSSSMQYGFLTAEWY